MGCIPDQISRPIRTGLLHCVDGEALLGLIVSLIQEDNRHVLAQIYIKEVSQFPITQLLDGGFWWEDMHPDRRIPLSCKLRPLVFLLFQHSFSL